MTHKRNTWQGFMLGALAAVLTVGLGIVPVLVNAGDQAAPATARVPVPQAFAPQGFGGSSPLVIPAAAFTADGTHPDDFLFSFNGYIQGDGIVGSCLKAPVYLPKGIKVTGLYASLYDNYTSDIFVTLRRTNRNTGDGDAMAEVSTYGYNTTIQQKEDTTINYAHVGDLYSTYYYYVTTCLHSVEHRLYSVRIYYQEYQIYLPVLLKNVH